MPRAPQDSDVIGEYVAACRRSNELAAGFALDEVVNHPP
jgi:hypothetical protein